MQAPPPQAQPAPPTPAPAVIEPEPQPETREEPTTVEAPTWEEEKAPAPKEETTVADPWPPTASAVSAEPAESDAPKQPEPAPKVEEKPEAAPVVEEKAPAAPETVAASEPTKPEVKPAPSPAPAPATPALAAPSAAAPSPKLSARPAAGSHRSSARYKVTDQPVTLPISFGSGLEKVGMQFGSLSLGGDGSVTVQCVIPIPFYFN